MMNNVNFRSVLVFDTDQVFSDPIRSESNSDIYISTVIEIHFPFVCYAYPYNY